MAFSDAAFRLALNGQSVIVTAITENGTARTVYTTSALTSSVSLPTSVSADTTYYVDIQGRTAAILSVTVTHPNGNSLGTYQVPVSAGKTTTVEPLPTFQAVAAVAAKDVRGQAALATNATTGFLFIPTCAGTPTGNPNPPAGNVALVYDTTNNKLYVYNGAWKGGTAPGVFS